MLHFIPAWYQQNQWCENEQSWFVRRMHTEFDDTVKQIQLFHRSKAYPYQIMLLGFAPNFRHFLHRQGMYRAPYWSCFDAIQGVRRKKAAVLSFHNLKWPEGIEFIYTPFVVVAMLNKEKYAQIDFGEDGNPIRIDLYQNGTICRQNIYDDRGFVASTIIFEDGQPLHQDYLTEDGTWKMRLFPRDGHVEINENCPQYLLQYLNLEQFQNGVGSRGKNQHPKKERHQNRKWFWNKKRYFNEERHKVEGNYLTKEIQKQFSRLRYDNLEQVIYEVLASYLELTDERDVFCVAMHGQHARLLKDALKDKKLILSFFEERYSVAAHPEGAELVGEADYVVVDSQKNVNKIRQESDMLLENIVAIPPYDSRVDIGISQQFDVQKIMVPVDDVDDEKFSELIRFLGEYLLINEKARIHLFTRNADYNRKQGILEHARRELEKAGLEEGWAIEEGKEQEAENRLELEEPVPVKFFVEQCVDELSVSKCMREQRVLVDMREVPELYLQIMAISIGIPQIVRTETEFVEHSRNGIILKDMGRLPKALHYYLDGLRNWNRAMVCSYELVKEYTTAKLLEKWKEVMESVGGDSYFTTGERELE